MLIRWMLVALAMGPLSAFGQATDLFIAEYVEGSSNNKAVEIHNATGAAVDLTAGGYLLEFYANGNTSPNTNIALSGVLDDGATYVVADNDADPAILAVADLTSASTFFNGDDAIVLRRGGAGGAVVDALGQVGFDPGSQWGSGALSTADNTLRRRPAICSGDTDPSDDFEPNLDAATGEWDGFSSDTFDDLGTHVAACGPPGTERLLLTEIATHPTGAAFVEIYNPNAAPVDLSDVYLTDATDGATGQFYFNVVTGANAGGGTQGDFHARFPEGASIDAGAYQTIALAGSSAFLTAYSRAPTYELFEDDSVPDGIPDLRAALPGSIAGQGALEADGEVVILYHWNSQADLVTDLDYALWGDRAEAVDKTALALDGPDAGTDPSPYAPDTPISGQDRIAPGAHPPGRSFQRIDPAEGTESTSGGNGVDGADETSENLSVTWIGDALPTPGLPPLPPGSPVLNEFVVDHVGADQDEFIELFGAPGTDYGNLTILAVEGDGGGSLGVIDDVFSVGSTDAGGFWTTGFLGSTLENGTQTFLLVTDFSGSSGYDLDADDNGVLDPSPPWNHLVDAVAVSDGDADDLAYTHVVLTPDFGGASRFPNGLDTDTASDWLRNDFDGQGLPSFLQGGTPKSGEAINTPGTFNAEGQTPLAPPGLIINEIDTDTPGSDTEEFIELYDGGLGLTPLDNVVVVFYNGETNTVYRAVDLDGLTTDAQGFFVLGNADLVPPPTLVLSNGALQNGPDAIALYAGEAADFPSGTLLTTDLLTDAVVYGPINTPDRQLLALLQPGQPQVDENAQSAKDMHSLQRLPNGSGGPRNTFTYATLPPTPGAVNGGADLELSVELLARTVQDNRIHATVQVRLVNHGPADAADIAVAFSAIPGLIVTKADASHGAYSNPIEWAVGFLAAGDEAETHITFSMEQEPTASFTAEVTSSSATDPDSRPADGVGDDQGAILLGRDPASGIERFAADLSLAYHFHPATAAPGDTVRLMLTVTNAGPSSTAGVEVAAPWPDGLSLVSQEDAGPFDPATGRWHVGKLRRGEEKALTLVATVAAQGAIDHTAEIAESHLPDPDSTPGNGQSGEDDQSHATLQMEAANARLTIPPGKPALGPGYPNPFNPTIILPVQLAEATHVRLIIYDLLGREVAQLMGSHMAAGRHVVRWDAGHLPSGRYFVRMEAGNITQQRWITLTK